MIIGLTPVMQNYLTLKEQYKDCLLFYRLGDFYELFFEDAILASGELNIVLTKRAQKSSEDVPMCGVPYHSVDQYISRLIKNGHKVAICEQMETPEEAKKSRGHKAVVKREVVRIVTPGTITDDCLLDSQSNNYLMSIIQLKTDVAIAYLDISTGFFAYFLTSYQSIANDLSRISPRELIISETLMLNSYIAKSLNNNPTILVTSYADNFFDLLRAESNLKDFYKVKVLDAIIDASDAEIISCGSLVEYLFITQKDAAPLIEYPKRYRNSNFMSIDATARNSLELTKCQNGDYRGSFIAEIDYTLTSVGARLLKRYINSPLVTQEIINQRLDLVQFLLDNLDLRDNIRLLLKDCLDFERSLARISLSRGSAKDLHIIMNSLVLILNLSELLLNYLNEPMIKAYYNKLGEYGDLMGVLVASLSDDVGANIKNGGVINPSYNNRLAELYHIRNNGSEFIAELCIKYRQETKINNLKINYNNVLGYFIEITAQHFNKMSSEVFIHRQTLANSVRYTTEELKEIEAKIITSRDQAIALEGEIFIKLCNDIIAKNSELALSSFAIAELDCFTAAAEIAREKDYVRPVVDDSLNLKIERGRHPILEKNGDFIDNDLYLSAENRLHLLTGPNMSGKSTYLRQNALIVIMAQIGLFVPAKFAQIGIVDKIFSRVGASDSISSGKSTFMVEMVETATILNSSTHRSLVLMDEVGRGTSLYDGLSIAWAVVEHIHNVNKCRGIFATHYHELSKLSDKLDALECYCVNVKKWKDEVVFLYKISKGICSESYGINVAKLAGVPMQVVERAKVILTDITREDNTKNIDDSLEYNYDENNKPEIDRILKSIDIDNISPREAWDILHKMLQIQKV